MESADVSGSKAWPLPLPRSDLANARRSRQFQRNKLVIRWMSAKYSSAPARCSMIIQPIDYLVLAWLVLAILSTIYVAFNQFRGNPEPAVMKWGFILVTLYMGPIALLLYVLADPSEVTYEAAADARGDQVLEPRIEDGAKVFDIEASVIRWNILPDETVEAS